MREKSSQNQLNGKNDVGERRESPSLILFLNAKLPLPQGIIKHPATMGTNREGKM